MSTPPSNELGIFETVTNDTDQHEVSDDNTRLLQDLPVSTFCLYTYYYLLPYNSRQR